MKSLILLLLATLSLSPVIPRAHAQDIDIVLTPNKMNDDYFNFTVKVDRLKDGNLLFRVLITPKAGVTFASGPSTHLAEHKEVKSESGHKLYSEGVVRNLPSEKAPGTMSCIFVVEEKLTQGPELGFQFQNNENFSGTSYFISLKDLVAFQKP